MCFRKIMQASALIWALGQAWYGWEEMETPLLGPLLWEPCALHLEFTSRPWLGRYEMKQIWGWGSCAQ